MYKTKEEKKKNYHGLGGLQRKKDNTQQDILENSPLHTVPFQARDFHVLQLKGKETKSDSSGKTVQLSGKPPEKKKPPSVNVRIQPGISRSLYSNNGEEIASVDGDTATSVQFTDYGKTKIKDSAIKKIADDNKGKITSHDILQYFANMHTLKKEKKSSRQNPKMIKKRKNGWRKHLTEYESVLIFTFRLEEVMDSVLKQGVIYGDDLANLEAELAMYYEVVKKHAGKDFLLSAVYVIKHAGNILFHEMKLEEREQIHNCLKEIQRRKEEMLEERQFILLELAKETPDDPEIALRGDDCSGFAWLMAELYPKTAESGKEVSTDEYIEKNIGIYSSVSGYSYHYFLWLTENAAETGGGVTVETCAGKGQTYRAVFSIRSSVNTPDNPVTGIDKRTIETGYTTVNNHVTRGDERILRFCFEKVQELLQGLSKNQNGKYVVPKAMAKEFSFANIYRFYSENRNKKPEDKKMSGLLMDVNKYFEQNIEMEKGVIVFGS
ncbi:hypothetical protein [[Clostridium] polysaccharolyticum]|uniref:Uncharacterized protein n=1 Tax=[Clostridium] polysaccharolyticum TaxID=29364 RepID=A0A1I0CHD1_9FIRM|nr:hypothetical protein [[Clostridium] polysaccharolyticum]SET19006.1 hypothetical protein SAMN04487772_11015 [[Clostridium] polysaccharolyticum]